MATTPSTPPPPPSPAAPTATPPRKGVSPIVWVLVGCGALLVIAALVLLGAGIFVAKKARDVVGDVERNPALAAAKLLAATNPEIEVVSSDDTAQTVTLRNRRTGETVTVDLEDVKKGRIAFTTGEGKRVAITASGEEGGGLHIESEQGEMAIVGGGEKFPSFLPRFPGLRLQHAMSSTAAEGSTAIWQFTSSDPPEAILEFYRREMEAKGFSVTVNTSRQAGRVSGGVVHATVDDDAQVLQVMVTAAASGSEGTLTFQMKPRE